jgi:tetratricopeptide (TPR) repeat protein
VRPQRSWIVPAGIAALTFLAFFPALSDGFVSWDDAKNFLDNPHYRGLGPTQLGWMWTTFHLGHYVPLSWMTLGLDYVIWGMNPFGYHLTSLLLHCVNAVLVFVLARDVLERCGVIDAGADGVSDQLPAAVAALLFAIHPLRVESVVWVTERRDVLSLLFYLVTILVYLSYCDTERRRLYWTAVLLFLCALLSKATAMTLPAVLLLLNVYPLRRLVLRDGVWTASARQVYLEVLPFAVLTAASVVLSIVALHPPDQLHGGQKIAVSAFSLCFYVYRTFVPANLSPLYEMPRTVDVLALPFVISYIGTIVLFAAALARWRRWPGVATAWLVFVVITLPMLGFVQNGPQIAADRYTYHAAPALALLAGAGFAFATRKSLMIARGAAGVVVVVLGVLTWNQSTVWHDSETLWTHALAIDPASPIAHSSLAALLYRRGQVDDAMAHSERAVALAPEFAEARNNLGIGLTQRGRIDDAIEQYRAALVFKPGYDEAHNNWGVAVARKGDIAGAIDHYRKALASNADNADAQVNWGNALVRLDKPADAIPHYQEALRIWIDDPDAHLNWGVALARENRLAEAVTHFRRALEIDPGSGEARDYLEKATQLLAQPR